MPAFTQHLETYDTKQVLFNRPDYSFINWIRLIGMFSVVMVHCMIYPTIDNDPNLARPLHSLLKGYQVTAYSVFYQFLRSGSILFFIVSGFLIGKSINVHTSFKYFLRRLNTIAIPYIIAFSLYWLKSMAYTISRTNLANLNDFTQLAIFKANVFLFSSAYWFIPNYFFGLALLLAFRRYVAKWQFGFFWLLLCFLFGINLHAQFFHLHTSTIFLGFTFFLWLGAYLGQRTEVLSFLLSIQGSWWLLITVFLYFVSYYEGVMLFEQGSSDPYNSLRISNQIFAVSLFVLLSKYNYLHKFKWLNPRQESFGIYLYHMFFVVVSVRLSQYVSWWPFRYQAEYSGLTLVGLSFLQGSLVYILTLLFVKAIASSQLRWLIGLRPSA